jgi:hypothetical protein
MVMISSMMAVGCFTAAAQTSVACGEMKSSAPSGAGAASQEATPVRWPLKMSAARVSAAPALPVCCTMKYCTFGMWRGWPEWHRLCHGLHIRGEQQPDSRAVGSRDLRSEFGGGERGGRAGGDLLQGGGIRRESHQVRQDQQDALALRDRPMADGSVTMRMCWRGCAGRKLGGFGLRERFKAGLVSSAMMTGWPGWPLEFSEAATTISLPR